MIYCQNTLVLNSRSLIRMDTFEARQIVLIRFPEKHRRGVLLVQDCEDYDGQRGVEDVEQLVDKRVVQRLSTELRKNPVEKLRQH